MFIDPLFETPLFMEQKIQCLALEEMVTEKCRAALTRRIPAIRDFFDLWYLQKQGIDIFSHKEVIIKKCKEITEWKRTLLDQYPLLESQIETDLLPVLQRNESFDLKSIYHDLLNFQKILVEEEIFS